MFWATPAGRASGAGFQPLIDEVSKGRMPFKGNTARIFLYFLKFLCYGKRMIRRLALFILIAFGLAGWFSRPARADTFELNDKTVLSGQPLAPNRQGIIIKGEDGAIPERVAWTNFTQSALKKLSQFGPAKPFVEPYLEPDEAEIARKAKPEITVKPVPRLERPDPRAGIGALFSSSLMLLLVFILYAANIYAGYEVSVFRNYPAGAVCGLAAVLPVIGPVIFLCLPTRIPPSAAELAHQEAEREALVAAGEVPAETAATEQQAHLQHAAPGAPVASAHPPPTVYQRGQTTFNRRFFETKLSGFLRVVPTEAEKDMLVCVRSARGEHAGQRISRVMPNELCLQVHKGGASSEVIIPYTEIQEVQIRHKETVK